MNNKDLTKLVGTGLALTQLLTGCSLPFQKQEKVEEEPTVNFSISNGEVQESIYEEIDGLLYETDPNTGEIIKGPLDPTTHEPLAETYPTDMVEPNTTEESFDLGDNNPFQDTLTEDTTNTIGGGSSGSETNLIAEDLFGTGETNTEPENTFNSNVTDIDTGLQDSSDTANAMLNTESQQESNTVQEEPNTVQEETNTNQEPATSEIIVKPNDINKLPNTGMFLEDD